MSSLQSQALGRPFLPDILDEYKEEAAFLWTLRSNLVHAPHFYLSQLGELDERIEAQLDGLRSGIEAGWLVYPDLDKSSTSEFFAAGVVAFESDDLSRFLPLVEAGHVPARARALSSALGWLEYPAVCGHISSLLSSESGAVRLLGIGAAALHRLDLGRSLLEAISSPEAYLRSRALRAAGELGRADLLPALREQTSAQEDDCRCAAAWSTAVLGNSQDALLAYEAVRGMDTGDAEKVIVAAFRRMDLQIAGALHDTLAKNPESARLATLCAGASGTTGCILWLLHQMESPVSARTAGEAFSYITGVNLALPPFERAAPAGVNFGPNDDPQDGEINMDVDEDLPWPDAKAVQEWWYAQQSQLPSGTRYFLGREITIESLNQVLRTGSQRQRESAAIELKALQPHESLFEVRAPAIRQLRILGSA